MPDDAEKVACTGSCSGPKSGCSNIKTDCLDKPLRKLFERHGKYVAKHPYPFLIIPLIVSACLSMGLKYFEIETDTEYLVTPKNGPAKLERKVVEQYFKLDQDQDFLPNRSPELDGFADVIVVREDGGNILTEEGLKTIIDLDSFIHTIKAKSPDSNNTVYSYNDICARWQGHCIEQPALMMFNRDPQLVNILRLEFPKHNGVFLGLTLGGVKLMENSTYIAEAKAMRIIYYVKYTNQKEEILANTWFKALLDALQMYEQDTPGYIIYRSAANSLTVQFDDASKDIMPKFAAPLALLITFSILSSMMSDWVRSKPWLALLGVISAGLALVSTFGLLSALGTRAVPQVGLVPFLTIGKCKYP